MEARYTVVHENRWVHNTGLFGFQGYICRFVILKDVHGVQEQIATPHNAVGASLFGVADLEALAEDTHKFESR